jgi:hypothetical protein
VGASYLGAPNVNRTLLFDLDSVPTEYVFGALPGVLTPLPGGGATRAPEYNAGHRASKRLSAGDHTDEKTILERLAGRPGLVDRSRLLPLEKPAAER